MTVFIYTLSDPLNNAIRYVGKTVNMGQRFVQHLCRKNDNTHKVNWISKLKRTGLSPKMEVLEQLEVKSEEEWESAERFWISYLRFIGCDLVNLDSGGNGGRSLSDETKKKISAFRKGKKLPIAVVAKMVASRTGRPRPQIFKDKIRAALKGRKRPPELAARMRVWRIGMKQPRDAVERAAAKNRGKKQTPERRERTRIRMLKLFADNPHLREKIRQAKLGKPLSEETRMKISVSRKAMFARRAAALKSQDAIAA